MTVLMFGAMVMSEPELLLRAQTRYVTLPHPESVLTSMVHVAIKDQADAQGWVTTCVPEGIQGL